LPAAQYGSNTPSWLGVWSSASSNDATANMWPAGGNVRATSTPYSFYNSLVQPQTRVLPYGRVDNVLPTAPPFTFAQQSSYGFFDAPTYYANSAYAFVAPQPPPPSAVATNSISLIHNGYRRYGYARN
jgi:hypothetical protein